MKNKIPSKAYDSKEFMHSHSARYLRVLSEFLEPEHRFKKYNINNTIVFFGSARSQSLKEFKKNKANDKFLKKRAYLSKSYDDCTKLAKKISEWSMKIKDKDQRFYICSGGGPGMMEAANKGAKLAKSKSIGLNISLPFEQVPNKYISSELNFDFHYFFIRKFWFLYYAKALVVFPGGFGTFDELFELLTLVQTKKLAKKVPVVIFGKEFWNEIINFNSLVEYGVISRKDLNLFLLTDSVDEAYEYLTKNLSSFYLKK